MKNNTIRVILFSLFVLLSMLTPMLTYSGVSISVLIVYSGLLLILAFLCISGVFTGSSNENPRPKSSKQNKKNKIKNSFRSFPEQSFYNFNYYKFMAAIYMVDLKKNWIVHMKVDKNFNFTWEGSPCDKKLEFRSITVGKDGYVYKIMTTLASQYMKNGKLDLSEIPYSIRKHILSDFMVVEDYATYLGRIEFDVFDKIHNTSSGQGGSNKSNNNFSQNEYSVAFNFFKMTKNNTFEEVKNEYIKLSIKNHPDRGGDVEVMKNINSMFDLIKEYYNK